MGLFGWSWVYTKKFLLVKFLNLKIVLTRLGVLYIKADFIGKQVIFEK